MDGGVIAQFIYSISLTCEVKAIIKKKTNGELNCWKTGFENTGYTTTLQQKGDLSYVHRFSTNNKNIFPYLKCTFAKNYSEKVKK